MAAVPAGWDQLFFGWKLDLDWSHADAAAERQASTTRSARAATATRCSLFFTGMLFLKGVLVSMAGPDAELRHPARPLDAQPARGGAGEHGDGRRLAGPAVPADRGHRRAGHRLLRPGPGGDGPTARSNFEKILPQRGAATTCPSASRAILIAALLAAFMSTFVSTVNSGAAYVVNDIYKRYINPHAPPRRYVVLGWITSSAVILLGIVFGFVDRSPSTRSPSGSSRR